MRRDYPVAHKCGSYVEFAMHFDLKNAPLAEAWIGFRFDTLLTGAWEKRAESYIESFADELPDSDVVVEESFEVGRRTEHGVPHSIRGKRRPVRFRSSNSSKTRSLQVGVDTLSYHILRAPESYPGFTILRTESMEKLKRYLEVFQPAGISQIELHMLDIVEIPTRDAERLRFEDYFNVAVNIPDEPFGAISDFSLRLVMKGALEQDQLQVRFSPWRSDSPKSLVRFRIQWDMISPCVPTSLDLGNVDIRLSQLHSHLRECFRASFTARCWELFGPTES